MGAWCTRTGGCSHVAGVRRVRKQDAARLGSMTLDPRKAQDLKQALKLDLTSFTLDLIGIVDPTGLADLTSGMISLWRGDWLSAGLSFLGIFQGLGDLA